MKQSEWLPILDLMTVLMMVFLLLAAGSYIHLVQDPDTLVYEASKELQLRKASLDEDVLDVFSEYFNQSKSSRDRIADIQSFIYEDSGPIPMTMAYEGGAFTFSGDTLFKVGSHYLSPTFQEQLNVFFPRLLELLITRDHLPHVAKIVISGHTSPEWGPDTTSNRGTPYSFIENMSLSQRRAYAVYAYLYGLGDHSAYQSFLTYNSTPEESKKIRKMTAAEAFAAYGGHANELVAKHLGDLQRIMRAEGASFAEKRHDGKDDDLSLRRVEIRVVFFGEEYGSTGPTRTLPPNKE